MMKSLFHNSCKWFLAVMFVQFSLLSSAQISFSMQSSYKYLKGNDAQNLSSVWMNSDFDDSLWSIANAPFRYGDGEGGTELTDMNGNYSTLFLRSKFSAENLDSIITVSFSVNWDDGFVLFINGEEALSQQRPETISYDAIASSNHESGAPSTFNISLDELNLVEGENTIAVLACNIQLSGSSDFYFDMAINAITEVPPLPEFIDSVGVSFTVNSGFYDSAFYVTLNTEIPDVSIVYTLDGSNPKTSEYTTTVSNNSSILIDPESTEKRGTTPAVVLRASVIKDGYSASKSTCRTFIFTKKVNDQSYPGHSWSSTDVNGQWLDYDMVVEGAYEKDMEAALTDIPTISLITDKANLFDASTGIYVNASSDGSDWERPCAIEMIDPKNNEGFKVNAGVRIRGGYSRGGWNPKHSFRLFFRSEYGDSKLYYPLFGDEGVDRFDKVDLRTAQNYSWNNDYSPRNSFVREVFTRDAQGETGQPYTRSRYYHLYLNGMYWGLYQTQERSEARWASDYLGGDNDDYDVIKVDAANNYAIYATDGNTQKWEQIYNIVVQGFAENENYFLLEGKDKNGRPMKNSEVLVDIDNLIDYMINIFYTGNFDAPVSKWFQNKRANNMYAVKNRNDKTQGFKFLVHDAEHAMMVGPEGPGIGLKENRVNIGDISSGDKMTVGQFSNFHIQWLHYRLCENTQYKQRFADIAWERLGDNGVFSFSENVRRLNNRADQIKMAIIAESARWGDTRGVPTKNKSDWSREIISLIRDYFSFRNSYVIEQLSDAGLYPIIDAPVIKVDGQVVTDKNIFIDGNVEITVTNSAGDIYYTLNGFDPRLNKGGIIPSAEYINSGSVITISESVILKIRANQTGNWSALREVNLIKEQSNYSNFKVTELHYHPTDSVLGADTINGKSYEFIEFRNTSTTNTINLSGLVIDSAIYYEFPDQTLLPPNEYFVVAAKPKKFYDRYGRLPSGNFSSSFSNSSEQIVVINKNTNQVVIDFTYMDKEPWNELADGKGSSLTATDMRPTGDPNDYSYWMASSVLHGTPFDYDKMAVSTEEEVTEFNSMEIISVYPNPTTNYITVNFNTDEDKEYVLNITDMKGVEVYRESYFSDAQISLSDAGIKHGLYILSVQGKNSLTTKKIVYSPH